MKKILVCFLVFAMLFSLNSCSFFLKKGEINVLDEGVVTGEGIDNSKALQKIFSTAGEGATIYFPEGVYEFDSTIYLYQKKNLTIVGDNAVLVRSGLDNTEKKTDERTAAFMIEGCSNITIKGITVKHSGNTSVSGEIVNVNKLLGCVGIKPYEGFEITGKELFTCLNTFDEKGIPDKRIENYSTETPYYIVPPKEDSSFTLLGLNDNELSVARKGDKVCLRSLVAEYLFIINNSCDTVFEDVTINNSYDGAFLIGSSSYNATFRRLKIKPENENILMSTNCDGIHISGLGGQLLLEDCEFYSLGDDCLNVHTTAGVVTKVTKNTISYSTKFVDNLWAKSGDIIEFYDSETFESLGTAELKKFSLDELTFDSIPEGVEENTILSNKTLHPTVTITGTKVHSNRARAFLLQTENVVVENCEIYGTALPAVLVAPDIVNWYEVGPGKDITIRNNTFENCGKHFNGVIQLASSHDGNFGRYGATVNKNIVVESNLFKNCGVSAVFAVSTNGLTVANNTFDDDYDGEGYKDYAIYAENSDNIIVKENKLKNPNDKLFGGNNCNNTVIE